MKIIDKLTSLDRALRAYAELKEISEINETLSPELIANYELRPRFTAVAQTSLDVQQKLPEVSAGAIGEFRVVREGVSRALILAHPESDGYVRACATIETWLSPDLQINVLNVDCSCPDFEPENLCSHVRDHTDPSQLNPNFLATMRHAWASYDPYPYYEYSGNPLELKGDKVASAVMRLLKKKNSVQAIYNGVGIEISRKGNHVRLPQGVRGDIRQALGEEAQKMGWVISHKHLGEETTTLVDTLNVWGDKNLLSQLVIRDVDDIDKAVNSTLPSEPSITGGWCEKDWGFGLEIEFLSDNRLSVIGEMLYEARLVSSPVIHNYHNGASYGWKSWSLEYDGSVDGEIVTPILHDVRKDWKQVDKVYQILNSPDVKARVGHQIGLHVNMGIPTVNMSLKDAKKFRVNLNFLVGVFQDVLWRAYASPERGEHRNTSYVTPYSNVDEVLRGSNLDRYRVLNFKQDRVEFRGPDGSLDVNHAKANVAIAAGLIKTALRLTQNEFNPPPIMHKVGTNNIRHRLMVDLGVEKEVESVDSADVLLFLGSIFDWDDGMRLAWLALKDKDWQTR